MAKMLRTLVFVMLFLVSSVAYINRFVTPGSAIQLPNQYPLVYVYPDLINETIPVGQKFNVSVAVFNLTDNVVQDPNKPQTTIPLGNLYGFDVQFTWNPNVLRYVNYTNPDKTVGGYKHPNVTVPVESFPNPIPPANYTGTLHQSVSIFTNVVNETGNIPGAVDPSVRAWFAATSFDPAAPYNGNGTLFTMTFEVVGKGESPLNIVDVTLSEYRTGFPIGEGFESGIWLNPPRNGKFILGAPRVSFTHSPDIGAVNKTVNFNATTLTNSTIDKYMWNFGDGISVNTTTNTVGHNYTVSGIYTASLVVQDISGVQSGNITQDVLIAPFRDLAAVSIYFSPRNVTSVKPNQTFDLTIRVDNLGYSSKLKFNESATLTISYNTTVVDFANVTKASWAPLSVNHTTITEYVQMALTFNSSSLLVNGSSLLALEKRYYFMLNVTGILSGYERDTTNNIKISNAFLLYTNQTIHQPYIDIFKFGYKILRTFNVPVIKGENTTFDIVVRNIGNEPDNFTLTLYTNGSALNIWHTTTVGQGENVTIEYSYALDYGYYNLTLQAKSGNVSDVRQGTLKVVKTPLISINYNPTSPVVGQEVTFNASATIHQDPSATITSYKWNIYEPGADPTSATPARTYANVTVISYTFNESGKWTVVLEVTDSNKLAFNSKRSATSAYRSELIVTVGQGGIPLEWIIAIVVIAIVAVAAIAFMLLRRRGKGQRGKATEGTEGKQ